MKKVLVLSFLMLFLTNLSSFGQEKSRSAKSGKFVTKKYADKHKSTTYTSKRKK